MAKISIPRQHHSGFEELLNLDETKQQDLVQILNETKSTLNIQSLVEQISERTSMPVPTALNVVQIVMSIYDLADRDNSTKNIARDLAEAVQETEDIPKPSNFDVESNNSTFFATSISDYTNNSGERSTKSPPLDCANLNEMFLDLNNCSASDSYNEDYLKPTDYSIDRVQDLLRATTTCLACDIPLGDLFPDGDGGLRIEWSSANHKITLSVPSDTSAKEYLYHGELDTYGIQYSLTPKKMAEYMSKLVANER